jgi:hypothetical protein
MQKFRHRSNHKPAHKLEPHQNVGTKITALVNVDEDPEYLVPDENSPELNVSDVQLHLDYSAYQQFLNKEVVVTGELTQGFTVHHKTAVLIDVREIKLAE